MTSSAESFNALNTLWCMKMNKNENGISQWRLLLGLWVSVYLNLIHTLNRSATTAGTIHPYFLSMCQHFPSFSIFASIFTYMNSFHSLDIVKWIYTFLNTIFLSFKSKLCFDLWIWRKMHNFISIYAEIHHSCCIFRHPHAGRNSHFHTTHSRYCQFSRLRLRLNRLLLG